MSQTKFRFAVGSPTGPRSAVWSLRARAHDAYLIAVEAGGIAKISFHLRTGEFSWGYVREFFEEERDRRGLETRDFERWKRPPPFAPGLSLPLRIYVANEALQVQPELPTHKKIHWYEPRPEKAIGFVFLLRSPGFPDNRYSDNTELELVQRLHFADHPETLHLYVHHFDGPQLAAAANRSILEFTKEFPHFRPQPGDRMYTEVDKPEPETGSRNLIEIPIYALPFAAA